MIRAPSPEEGKKGYNNNNRRTEKKKNRNNIMVLSVPRAGDQMRDWRQYRLSAAQTGRVVTSSTRVCVCVCVHYRNNIIKRAGAVNF